MKCALDFTMTGKSIPFETELLDYSISEEDEAQNEDEDDSNMTPSEDGTTQQNVTEATPLKTISTQGIQGQNIAVSATPQKSREEAIEEDTLKNLSVREDLKEFPAVMNFQALEV